MTGGIELRKQRRLGEVLTDSFNLLFAYWRPLAIITAPFVLVNIVLQLLLLGAIADWPELEEPITEDDIPVGDLLLLFGLIIASIPVQLILYQLVSGAGVAFLDGADRGQRVTPALALAAAKERLGLLVGAAFRATVIIFLLSISIIGIPWAIMRFVRWLFINQIVMLENRAGQEVLADSAELVRGHWWGTLGRIIVTGMVIGIPVSLLSQALFQISPGVIGTILSTSTALISVPFGIISLTLVYFNLRTLQDGAPAAPAAPSAAPVHEFAYLDRERLNTFSATEAGDGRSATAPFSEYDRAGAVDDATASQFMSLRRRLQQGGRLHQPDDPPGQPWPTIAPGEFIDVECVIEFTALDQLIERFRQFGPPPGFPAPTALDFASIWLRPGQQPLGGRVFASLVELRYLNRLKSQLAGRYRVMARVQQVLDNDESLDLPTLYPEYNMTFEELETMIADRATMRRYGRVPVREEFMLSGPALVLTLVAVYR